MLEVLEKKVEELSVLTEVCTDFLLKDDFERVEDLVNRREVVLEEIKGLVGNEEIRELFIKRAGEYDIMNSERKLMDLMSEKRESLKKEMGKINKSKMAHGVYNRNFTKQSFFLQKKM